jgi:hypothetical protein
MRRLLGLHLDPRQSEQDWNKMWHHKQLLFSGFLLGVGCMFDGPMIWMALRSLES